MTLPLLITPGDPQGIGPEVAVKAAQSMGLSAILIGDVEAVRRWAPEMPECEEIEAGEGLRVLAPPRGEPVEVASIRMAVEACMDGRASALVTGPIHKGRLAQQGFAYSGHTDFLGALCESEPLMAFVGAGLRVALATTHIPLSEVPSALDRDRVERCLRLCAEALDALGISRKKILVAGINPHAGEDGLIGREELDNVVPVCELLRGEGFDIEGPMAAEIAFTRLRKSHGDILLAMHHDQGLAPMKLLAFGELVNWSLGLPIIRTSVDHGTADDIAGKGIADPRSMVEAIALAIQLSEGARRSQGS